MNGILVGKNYSPFLVNFNLLLLLGSGALFTHISRAKEKNFLSYDNFRTLDGVDEIKKAAITWKATILLILIQFTHLHYAMFMPVLNQIIHCLIIASLCIFLSYPVFKDEMKMLKQLPLKKIVFFVLFYSVIIIILNFLHGYILDVLVPEVPHQSLSNYLPFDENDYALLLPRALSFSMLTAVIIAPLSEELISRGFVFSVLYNKNRILAYTVSSLIFGFLHIDPASPYLFYEFIMSFFKVAVGVVFARSYEKTECIIVPISIHMISNATISIPALLAALKIIRMT